MTQPRLINTFIRGFLRDRKGATALLFGLLTLPLLGAMAAAIDFGLLKREQNIQQTAADAAALIAASRASTGERPDAELIALAKATFADNYTNLGGKPNAPEPTVTISDRTVTVNFSRQIDTAILGALGYDTMTANVLSKAHMEIPVKLEVVMVLDYSSSMDGGFKYQTMRDAAVQLIDDLTTTLNDPGHKFGLVPFAEHVYASLPSDYVVGQASGGTWSKCTKDRSWPHNTQTTTPTPNDDTTKWISSAAEDNGGSGMDPCDNYVSRSLMVAPLTDDESLITNQLQSMTPYQGTHIALGMEMGWHVVSQNQPFDQGVANNTPDLQKIIVLLTDGRQNQPGNGPGGINSEDQGKDNLKTLCDNIKADGIKIITIGFDLSTQEAKDPLINCASSSNDFFDADDNSDLITSFQVITKTLAGRVRLIQ